MSHGNAIQGNILLLKRILSEIIEKPPKKERVWMEDDKYGMVKTYMTQNKKE